MGEGVNDLALYFKQFATILLTVDLSLSILNWDHPDQNAITKNVDIACNEETVKQYFAGHRVIQSKHHVQGFVKVKTSLKRSGKQNLTPVSGPGYVKIKYSFVQLLYLKAVTPI